MRIEMTGHRKQGKRRNFVEMQVGARTCEINCRKTQTYKYENEHKKYTKYGTMCDVVTYVRDVCMEKKKYPKNGKIE